MIKSMTGYAAKEMQVAGFGKISVELRSTNHKFLEIVSHLPDGFLSLDDGIKRLIELRIKRGRVNCLVTFSQGMPSEVMVNILLIKQYVRALAKIKKQFRLEDGVCLDTLIHLPGAVSLIPSRASAVRLWPSLKTLMTQAVADLTSARQKEGHRLYAYLRTRARHLTVDLSSVKSRFKKFIAQKISLIKTDEEKASFLKESDISEEITRLEFHVKNFTHKLTQRGPVGKELDFIAQEMQREANTMGAKSCDALISAKVVQLKSHIEKIREQSQNIE